MPLSPYSKPFPNIRVKDFAPVVPRPSKEEVDRFPEDARALLDKIAVQQGILLEQSDYDLDWVKGRHFLLAGATGPGLGGSLEGAARKLTEKAGSVTVLARDLSRSVGFETGKAMAERAEQAGFKSRYHLLNEGMSLEGPTFEKIIQSLKEAGANDLIYINTVAAAQSGLLPNMPEIYIKDIDSEGLFQWKLNNYLDEKAIASTKSIMGEMAAAFPKALEGAGFKVAATCYADWRGSLDRSGRDAESPHYGRQGAYSTSLYLPKLILQEDTYRAYGTGRIVVDAFLPIMRTRALPFIPGGMTMSYVYDKLMELEGVRRIDVPELALGTLDSIGKALSGGHFNPFPKLDAHEQPLEDWFNEVVLRLNNDESSQFFWKKWVKI